MSIFDKNLFRVSKMSGHVLQNFVCPSVCEMAVILAYPGVCEYVVMVLAVDGLC
jgi:hypothetical protein